MPDRCATTGKQKYDMARAFHAAREMERKKGRDFNHYRCPDCKAWHVGKSMQRDFYKRQEKVEGVDR